VRFRRQRSLSYPGRAPALANCPHPGDTAHRFFQGQLHGVAQVGTPGRTTTTAAVATAKDVAKDVAERITKIGTTAKATVATATLALIHAGMTVLVIAGTQVLVGQDLIGFLDLFELLFGCGITLIAIRVKLHRQTLVRLLDLALVGIFRYPEHFIEIAL
jgi:hypothetical protein